MKKSKKTKKTKKTKKKGGTREMMYDEQYMSKEPKPILTKHAKERMEERNITNNDISRIINTVEPTEIGSMNPDPEKRDNIYIFKEINAGNQDDIITVLTTINPPGKPKTIITVIRNDVSYQHGGTRKRINKIRKKNKKKSIL
jgi:hypothetical protein